jgi:hypothetical protein
MTSFMDRSKIPPQVEPYHLVEIPTSKKLPKDYVPVPLETTTEAEGAIKDNNPSLSPSKVLSQQLMASKWWKCKAIEDAQHKDHLLPLAVLHGGGARHLMIMPTTKGHPSTSTLPLAQGETLQSTNIIPFGYHPRKYWPCLEQSHDGCPPGGLHSANSFGTHDIYTGMDFTGANDIPPNTAEQGTHDFS